MEIHKFAFNETINSYSFRKFFRSRFKKQDHMIKHIIIEAKLLKVL